jgi:hypothetical protein
VDGPTSQSGYFREADFLPAAFLSVRLVFAPF